MDLAPSIAELDRQFGISGIAGVVAGNGGLACVRVNSPTAIGEMYLHGAHVTSWQPPGAEEVLFVSTQSRWEDGRAIRGGVPICFPWFAGKSGDPAAPMHGLFRTKAWRLESIAPQGDAVVVSMFADSDESTKKWWPAEFRLVHRATFGGELQLELALTNTGRTSLRFEEALHTYFSVGQIGKVQVQGLDGVHFLDKTDSNCEKIQQGALAIASETDRIYLNTAGTIDIKDQALRRRIRIAKENSLATVVWNPWGEKARALADFGDDEWTEMVCIETCNVAAFAVELAPGKQHTMRAVISVAKL